VDQVFFFSFTSNVGAISSDQVHFKVLPVTSGIKTIVVSIIKKENSSLLIFVWHGRSTIKRQITQSSLSRNTFEKESKRRLAVHFTVK
jgi:hypothetical protein